MRLKEAGASGLWDALNSPNKESVLWICPCCDSTCRSWRRHIDYDTTLTCRQCGWSGTYSNVVSKGVDSGLRVCRSCRLTVVVNDVSAKCEHCGARNWELAPI